MTLKDTLYAMKTEMEAKIPAETLGAMHRANDELRASGILDKILKSMDKMPDMALPDSSGNMVQLSDVLAKGPLVLTFFRGQW